MLTSTLCPPPVALRSLKAWLVWRLEGLGPKPLKVPYYTNGVKRGGSQGSDADRARLVSYDEALKTAKARDYSGIGFCPFPEFNITALDFDNCIDAQGRIHPQVETIIDDTYAEVSPSGRGIRAFVAGNLGNHKSKDPAFGFETFASNGFVTVTGRVTEQTLLLNDNHVAPVSPALKALYASRFTPLKGTVFDETDDDPLTMYAPKVGLTLPQAQEILDTLDSAVPYEEWLSVGMALNHEFEDEGFPLWVEWSRTSLVHSPSDQQLQSHWDSFRKNTGKVVTARTLLKLGKERGISIDTEVATPEEFDLVAHQTKSRFEVIPAADFESGPRPTWLIKNLLPRAELAVLFGASGSGKSFIALGFAMAIARGVPWRNLKTQKGRVVYIAAEGAGGFRNRLSAYAQHNKINLKDADFGVIHAAPNFLQKTDALDVAAAIKQSGGADLVIVDTFAQVTPGGNENSGEDVSKVLAHCKGIHRATGALVLLVHHSGKDSTKGARGWSGLRAAADAEIEVIKNDEGPRVMQVSKQKDGIDTGAWAFELDVVPIGIDADGDVIDSCVCRDVPLTPSQRGLKKMGKWERAIYDVVAEIAESQTEGIEVKHVIAEVLRRSSPPEVGRRDTRKQFITRALNALSERDDAPFYEEAGCLVIVSDELGRAK